MQHFPQASHIAAQTCAHILCMHTYMPTCIYIYTGTHEHTTQVCVVRITCLCVYVRGNFLGTFGCKAGNAVPEDEGMQSVYQMALKTV